MGFRVYGLGSIPRRYILYAHRSSCAFFGVPVPLTLEPKPKPESLNLKPQSTFELRGPFGHLKEHPRVKGLLRTLNP